MSVLRSSVSVYTDLLLTWVGKGHRILETINSLEPGSKALQEVGTGVMGGDC